MLTFNNILILEEGDILKMQAATTGVYKDDSFIITNNEDICHLLDKKHR